MKSSAVVVTPGGACYARVMILVGLTGGVATGKSTVARLFKEQGARVIDADQLARDAVKPGKPAWRDIVRIYGREILLPNRTIDRRRLAGVVFAQRSRLRQLNAIVHPRVAREQARQTRLIAREAPDAVVIYDVPLLFEAGVDARVRRVIVVTADRATQMRRLKERNGLGPAEAVRRLRSQMSLREKVRRADYVIDGTRQISDLRQDVKRVYEELTELAKGKSRRTAAVRGTTRRSTGRTSRRATAASRPAPPHRDGRWRRASVSPAPCPAGLRAAPET